MGAAAAPLMGIQMLGSYQQGRAQAEAGSYESQIDTMNATLARRYAVDAIDRGNVMGGRALAQGTSTIAAARASAGASGFTTGSSSLVDVLATTRMMSSLDAATIKNSAARESLGYETQAMNYEAQGRLAQYKGQNQMIGTILGGIGGAAKTGYSAGFPSFGA